MLSKLTSMKFINNKIALSFFVLLFSTGAAMAQEIINQNIIDTIKKVSTVKKKKIDGVIAKVGDYIILDSDIDKTYLEIAGSGGSIKDVTRCQILGKIMEDKLYAHQAVQDSLKVTDSEVKTMMDERLNYMVEQIGSMEKVVSYYKKSSEEEFRTYFFDILKEQRHLST